MYSSFVTQWWRGDTSSPYETASKHTDIRCLAWSVNSHCSCDASHAAYVNNTHPFVHSHSTQWKLPLARQLYSHDRICRWVRVYVCVCCVCDKPKLIRIMCTVEPYIMSNRKPLRLVTSKTATGNVEKNAPLLSLSLLCILSLLNHTLLYVPVWYIVG